MKFGLLLGFILLNAAAFGQGTAKNSKPDTVKIKSEIRELETAEKQLTEKIKILRIACRQDSIGILALRLKKKDVDYQTAVLKSGMADLENLKDKSKDQKKLLRDLKLGHMQIKERFANLDQELGDIETNYNNNLTLLFNAETLVKDLSQKLRLLKK